MGEALGPTFLETSEFLDWEHDAVQSFTWSAVGNALDSVEVAQRIFVAVRDQIWYDPYTVSEDPAHYKASHIALAPKAYCVPKAVLLTAAARAAGIPARVGFADVRNHLQTGTLRERMGGSDLFVYHGYSELLLNGRWVKATPAFNAELCARFGVEPIAFDGVHDALLHAHTADGTQHMEYLKDHGWYSDLPLAEILDAYRMSYGDMTSPAPTEPDTFTA